MFQPMHTTWGRFLDTWYLSVIYILFKQHFVISFHQICETIPSDPSTISSPRARKLLKLNEIANSFVVHFNFLLLLIMIDVSYPM